MLVMMEAFAGAVSPPQHSTSGVLWWTKDSHVSQQHHATNISIPNHHIYGGTNNNYSTCGCAC